MNTDMIAMTTDWIDAHEGQFNIARWIDHPVGDRVPPVELAATAITGPGELDCGTTCCIAGAALVVAGDTSDTSWEMPSRAAAELMDLSEDEATELFYPASSFWLACAKEYGLRVNRDGEVDPTGPQAVRVLRDLLAGEVTLDSEKLYVMEANGWEFADVLGS